MMRFESKYAVGDKVWFRCNNIESYIKAHPYEELSKILKACFHEGYVYCINIETNIFTNEPLVSYVISDKCLNKDDDPVYEQSLQNWSTILSNPEQDVFSSVDEVTNMIKETHKNVLNELKYAAEQILKKYD